MFVDDIKRLTEGRSYKVTGNFHYRNGKEGKTWLTPIPSR